MEYLVNLTLKSNEVTANFSGEWVEKWDSHFEFMNFDYFASGGSAVRLNPESEFDFEDSPFSGTEVDDSEDPAFLDELGDGFELISSETLDEGSVEITYQLCPQIEVSVEAGSEEEAKNLCQSQGFELFDIIDVAADEVVGTLSIQVNGVREA